MDQNLPDFPTIAPPEFGGKPAPATAPGANSASGPSGATPTTPAVPTQGVPVTSDIPSTPAQPATPAPGQIGSDPFGNLGGLSFNPDTSFDLPTLGSELGFLDDPSAKNKKTTRIILIGGIAALAASAIFISMYFYFQAQTTAKDDVYIPPPTTRRPTPVASDAAGLGPDAGATTDAQLSPSPAMDMAPKEYKGKNFTIELPKSWEIQKKPSTTLYTEVVEVNVYNNTSENKVRVAVLSIQVSNQRLGNKFDEDIYKILNKDTITIDGVQGEQVTYQKKDDKQAVPTTSILVYRGSKTYRFLFTLNDKYSGAEDIQKAFDTALESFTFSSPSGTSAGASGSDEADLEASSAAEQSSQEKSVKPSDTLSP